MLKSRKIVFIMTDTQRWDMLGCYRKTGLRTPNLDRLAGEGIRYDRAYTTQPVCQPARAGIFTGQYPHSVGSWANSSGLSNNARTIGQRLSKEGVHTAYIGKFHLDGGDYFGLGKCPDGWDPAYWYDMRNYLEELTDQERLDSRNANLMLSRDFPETFTFGHRCTNRAIDFLQHCQSEDFFLVLSYDEPHAPSICPMPYSKMYQDYAFPISDNVYDDMREKPEHQKVWGRKQMERDKSDFRIRAPFLFGCNSYIDHEIGRVMDAVEQYAKDAVVIYTSDHGDMLCSHNLTGKGPCAYDEITRIPLIIKGKGVPRGQVDPHPVSHINLTPTILEMMDAVVPPVLEGKSILREIADPTVRTNDYVFMEFGRYEVDHDGFGGFQPLRTVFDGRYKLTINLLCGDELYDLQEDPGEMQNLIHSARHRKTRNQLHDVLLQHMNETRDPFRGYYWERRPWREDASPATWDYTLMTRQREEDPYFEDRQLDYGTGLSMKDATREKG